MNKIYVFLLICFSLLSALIYSTPSYAGDPVAGEAKFKSNCKQCHGPAGIGIASYPKVSGNTIDYTRNRLQTYRAGTEVGPNSALMIMMAKPLTDEDIENLSVYLKDARK